MPLTRRDVLKAAAAAPLVVPARVVGRDGTPPSEEVRVGTIASGNRAQQLMDVLPPPGRIVAISDCDARKIESAKSRFGEDWPAFGNWRDMLDDDSLELDAVIVATPDHGRALQVVTACAAGLDVYAEKPLSLTVAEGRAMVDAARKHGRVVQVGTQQRSMPLNAYCCRAIREGRLGKVKAVLARNYAGPGPMEELPAEEPPAELDWQEWLGPAPGRPYNDRLIFDWMKWRDYSGGLLTNWGAHGVDQIQWALGQSDSGPVSLRPVGDAGQVVAEYEGGPEVRFELDRGPLGGAIFLCEAGKIEVNRNRFATNPKGLLPDAPPPSEATADSGPDWTGPHLADWLRCIQTRERPAADVAIGHRSVSFCHLVGITREVGRPLRWDPAAERFEDDAEANGLLSRPHRAGYGLPS